MQFTYIHAYCGENHRTITNRGISNPDCLIWGVAWVYSAGCDSIARRALDSNPVTASGYGDLVVLAPVDGTVPDAGSLASTASTISHLPP